MFFCSKPLIKAFLFLLQCFFFAVGFNVFFGLWEITNATSVFPKFCCLLRIFDLVSSSSPVEPVFCLFLFLVFVHSNGLTEEPHTRKKHNYIVCLFWKNPSFVDTFKKVRFLSLRGARDIV